MTNIDTRFTGMLREGRPVNGMFTGFANGNVIEMAAFAGFDFVIIDNEHGPAGIETTMDNIRAAKAAGIVPLVRTGMATGQEILRTLDVGATGIQIPQVDTADQLRQIVDWAKYPPIGNRGVAFSTRAAGWGFFGGPKHMEISNAETCIISHVETGTAVKNLDELLKVDHVNVFFVGPNDLSTNLGYQGNYAHPDMQKILEETIRKIVAAGKVAGIIVGNPEEHKKYVSWGARYLPHTVNGLLSGAMKSYIAGIKG